MVVEDTLGSLQRPKLEQYETMTFFVFHPLAWNAEKERVVASELAVILTGRRLLTVRDRHLPFSPERLLARVQSLPHLEASGPGAVLYALVDQVLKSYDRVTAEIERRFRPIEERILEGDPEEHDIAGLYRLRRACLKMRRSVQPTVEICRRLQTAEAMIGDPGLTPYFRDLYYNVLQDHDDVHTITEEISYAFEASARRADSAENEIQKRLAAYAAVVAVPTAVAGIYGMNFEVMPELTWDWGYFAVLGLMAAIVAYLVYRFRKAGWM
jgi:magnesium transporter